MFSNNTTYYLFEKPDTDTSVFGYLLIPIIIFGTLTCVFSIYLTIVNQNSLMTLNQVTTSFNTLFINLTVSSLLVCSVTLPVTSYTLIAGGKNWFGSPHRSVVCLIDAFLQLTAVDTALYTHGFIALNRLLATSTYPQRHESGSKLVTITFVVLSWLVPVILYVFPLFHVGGGFSYSHRTNRCTLVERDSLLYWHLVKALHFFLPFALMVVCYVTVLVRRTASSRRVQQEVKVVTTAAAHNRRMRKEIQVTRAVFLTCLSFVLCYLPNTVSAILVWLPQQTGAEPNMVTLMLVWLGCSFNPFLYLLINPTLRQQTKRIASRALHCFRSPTAGATEVPVGYVYANEVPLQTIYARQTA